VLSVEEGRVPVVGQVEEPASLVAFCGDNVAMESFFSLLQEMGFPDKRHDLAVWNVR
jgi:hypothetical protein